MGKPKPPRQHTAQHKKWEQLCSEAGMDPVDTSVQTLAMAYMQLGAKQLEEAFYNRMKAEEFYGVKQVKQ